MAKRGPNQVTIPRSHNQSAHSQRFTLASNSKFGASNGVVAHRVSSPDGSLWRICDHLGDTCSILGVREGIPPGCFFKCVEVIRNKQVVEKGKYRVWKRLKI